MQSLGSTYRLTLVGVLLTLICSACLDQIEYDLPPEDRDNITIQGRFVKGNPHTIQVEVKRVFGFKSGSTFVFVDSVQLWNEQGQSIELRNPSLGVYRETIPVDDPTFEVQEGDAFQVVVWTVDGRVYESDFEKLYPVTRVDSISTRFIDREISLTDGREVKARVEFFIHTPLAIVGEEERTRINWLFQHTFQMTDAPEQAGVPSKTCYISENLNIKNIAPMDGNILNRDYLMDHAIYGRNIDYRFQQGYYLNVFQQSLSAGAAEYFRQIDKLIERTGNMFEGPVGPVVTNFRNRNDETDKVFGYFYATEVDTFNVEISPYDIYVPIPGRFCPPPYPPPPGEECALDICCDCLDAPMSTTTKPSYW